MLFHLFHNYLLKNGTPEDRIIEIALDDRKNIALRDPDAMLQYLENRMDSIKDSYTILDEVQYMNEFEDVLNTLLHIPNVDIYVTGSNSKFLSSDVITEFRGRGDEVHVYPLSFKEYTSVYPGTVAEAWDDYTTYGGLPLTISLPQEDRVNYLVSLFQKVYLSDIVERHKVRNEIKLAELVDILASSAGSYTNLTKLAKTFKSVKNKLLSDKTIKNYIDYLIDSYLISKAVRFDIKGKKYIDSSGKYYFEDVGLHNARLGFRQLEDGHLMENILYNELRIRGYHVDIGVVKQNITDELGQRKKKQLEVDFVATKGSEKYYLQSAFAMSTPDKIWQEQRSLLSIPDSFKKIIVVGGEQKVRRDDNGLVTIGIHNFLLDKDSLRL